MRIALIGDLQYGSAEDENLTYKMKQLADLNPEFAVIMGDIGGPYMRSVAGYEETRDLAEHLGCPWHVILGNHDVEYAPGEADRFDCFGGFAEQEIMKEQDVVGEPIPEVEFTIRSSKDGLYVKFAD